jgi:hypothetical protein
MKSKLVIGLVFVIVFAVGAQKAPYTSTPFDRRSSAMALRPSAARRSVSALRSSGVASFNRS